jgi:ABC-type nitrate/sulfonate/bicarbonate transport system substrate-binding protein
MKQIQVALFALVVALFQTGALAQAQSLKVGMTSKTLFYLPFYAGLKKGFYNAENLKVELILIGRSDVQLQALLTRRNQFRDLELRRRHCGQ